ncbi:MAG: DUF1080 domain-containing protein, partial [Phycisphaerae bacterium]|nr:DUF1080 domain-containing protein [Phycisphaerae bacterium]
MPKSTRTRENVDSTSVQDPVTSPAAPNSVTVGDVVIGARLAPGYDPRMARPMRSTTSMTVLRFAGFLATTALTTTALSEKAVATTAPLLHAACTAPTACNDAERLPQPALKPLFPERSIKGWHIVGGLAKFTMQDGVLTGSGTDTRNAFLVSPRNYGDFVLDLEFRIEEGNSGIQIRSQVREDEGTGSLVGYQVEIDPTPRAWSGGIYDEGRRGWLFDLKDNEAARNAFKAGEWNRYVIECRGPWFRTWVNGVPAANGVDIMDEDGRIAFQVHSGRTTIQWRRVMIAELPPPKVVRMFDGGA